MDARTSAKEYRPSEGTWRQYIIRRSQGLTTALQRCPKKLCPKRPSLKIVFSSCATPSHFLLLPSSRAHFAVAACACPRPIEANNIGLLSRFDANPLSNHSSFNIDHRNLTALLQNFVPMADCQSSLNTGSCTLHGAAKTTARQLLPIS